jgi:hypothetical protein
MAISGVGSGFSAATLLQIQENSATQSVGALLAGAGTAAAGGTSGVAGGSSGDSVQISGPGKLFSELQQLQSQNPTQFKQVTGQIAAQLQAAAHQTTGGQASFLTTLASDFQTASSTGNVAALRPPQFGSGSSVEGTYNAQGQLAQSLLSAINPANGSSAASGSSFALLIEGSSSSSSGSQLAQLLGAGGTSNSSSAPSLASEFAQLLGLGTSNSSSASSLGTALAQLIGNGTSASGAAGLAQLFQSGSSAAGGSGAAASSSSSTGVDLGQLFKSISAEVTQALNVKS